MNTPETEGIVYILTNPCFREDCVKIGMSSRIDADFRLHELDTTGVPAPFEVYAKLITPFYLQIERCMHNYFEDERVRMNREFFNITPNEALDQLKFYQHQFGGTLIVSNATKVIADPTDENEWVPKNTKFSLNGETGLSMGNFFNKLVRASVADGKIPSIDELKMVFPSTLTLRKGDYCSLFIEGNEEYLASPEDRKKRFCSEPIELEGINIYTSNQWGRSIFKTVYDTAQDLGYQVSIDSPCSFTI